MKALVMGIGVVLFFGGLAWSTLLGDKFIFDHWYTAIPCVAGMLTFITAADSKAGGWK